MIETSFNTLAEQVHAANQKWWFRPGCNACGEHVVKSVGIYACCNPRCERWGKGTEAVQVPITRNKGELLMLVASEVAEAMEGERKNLMDDKLPHRRMAEVELVDVLIRVLDYAGAFGYDLDGAYREKQRFNAKREDHKAEATRIAAGNPLECKAVSMSAGYAPSSEETK